MLLPQFIDFRLEIIRILTLISLLLASQAGFTEKFKRFDNFELHYSVVNTTFLSPFVAEKYGITRGERHAILNLSLRELSVKGSTSVGMELSGRTWDLIQAQDLQFSKIREEGTIYFLAEFKFINEEWRFFELEFSPEGSKQKYQFKFKHQLYIN